MAIAEFIDDDQGYALWAVDNPNGYVLNLQRSRNTSDARVHTAQCPHIAPTGLQMGRDGRRMTSSYIKLCARSLAELNEWSRAHLGGPLRQCGRCLAGGRTKATRATMIARSTRLDPSPATSDYEFQEVEGMIRLTGMRYIPFENASAQAQQARGRLRDRLRTMKADSGAILHARYSGYRPANTDVENLLIYNIDQGGAIFRPSTVNGIRFEEAATNHSAAASDHPGCHYTYRLISPEAPLHDWIVQGRLAEFTGTELGEFAPRHRLAQTWLALKNTTVETTNQPAMTTAAFGVFLDLEVPAATSPGLAPELLKSLIDGVVCAFQSHRNRSTIGDITARIASQTGKDANDIAAKLLNHDRAVLGSEDQLVRPWRESVQWCPADHRCVVGQVLRHTSDRWRLNGRIYMLKPNHGQAF